MPNIVLVGLPNVRSLEKTARKLRLNNIPHHEWHEPDFDFGFTAICTAPLDEKQRIILKDYRVYAPIAQLGERPALTRDGVGSNPTGCAIAPECTDTSSVRV